MSVAEDATRVIRKVQYDAETNKLLVVGFVLPCDEDGLPLCDSFMATTFKSMQKYFSEESIARSLHRPSWSTPDVTSDQK